MAVAVVAALPGYGAVQSDLVCAYPPSTASAWGGEANARVNIANQVIGSNALNDQSGTGESMNIVGYIMSSRDSSGEDNGTVLGLVAGNAAYADVRNYAASVGADQVLYIPYASTGAAGNAYQPGTYSAVNSTWWWMVVFAHETGGHNYSLGHGDGHLNPKTIMLHNYCGGGAAWPYLYSNPNVWNGGVNMLGDGYTTCSSAGNTQPNGGDGVYGISSRCQSMCDTTLRVVYAPVLNNAVYHWSFTNAPGAVPASTTNYDLVSHAPAVVRGNGAAYTGSALRIPGGTTGNVAMNSMSAYIDLPNGILSSQTNITIEIWATPQSAQNWARIMDFGNSSVGEIPGNPTDAAPGGTSQTDGLTLTACIGTDITQQRFEALHGGSDYQINSALATTAGVQHHYAITFTDGAGAYTTNGGRWQWYRDGDSVGFLDASNHLASVQDVNEWLGRSEWSGDSLANNDYAEVRISSVALNQWQVRANYLLGPNFVQRSTTLAAGDLYNGGTRSFNTAGNWSDGLAPSAGKTYDMADFNLTTPNTTSAYTFAGDALHASGGIFFDGASGSSTITVNKFQIDNEEICNTASGTMTLAGNLLVTNNNIVRGAGGPVNVSANLSGNGSLTLYAGTVSLAGNNTNFTGIVRVGNGIIGSLSLSSEAQLGANPSSFTSDQLIFNRGWLYSTATFAISNSNRGIMIGVNDGIFDVAAGTTLTLGSPLTSGYTSISGNALSVQSQASGIVAGCLIKQDSGTLVLNGPNGGFNGALKVDSGSSSANDGVVRIANSSAVAGAFSPIYIRNSGSGSSTLQLDGTSGNITLPQTVSLNGRTTSTVAIENLAGTNTIAGGLSLNVGGSLYQIQSDANATLNLGGTIATVATSARTLTLQGGGNHGVSGTIADGGAPMNLTKTGSGTATISGNNTYSGATTVSQGTLKLQPSTAVLHLTFDNAAGSSSGSVITNTGAGGSALNGTIVGSGATIVSGGKFGNALNLNGTGGSAATNIVLLSSKVLNTDSNANWTVAYWVKTSTAGAVIMYQGDGTWSSSGQTTFYLNAGSSASGGTHAGLVRYAGGWLTGSAALANGAWHHVALVDNAGTETIFVDGSADTVTAGMTLPLASGANQIWIGGSPDTGDGTVKMTGQIDEVYMFNRALNQTEVLALVNSNNPQSPTAPVLPVTTPVSVAGGALFDLGGMTQTINSLAGAGNVTNTASGTATLIVSNNTGGTTTFSGSLGDTSLANALSFVQTGGATNIFSGANTYRGATVLNGGALFVNGALGSGAVTNGAWLGGNGTLGGALTVSAGGTLSPGTGIGKLSVNSSVMLLSGSATFMEISKSPKTNDQLIASGALSYGGNLVVTNLAGTLAGGDSFALFQAGSFNGNFTSNSLPALGAGLAWSTASLSRGILSVVQTAPTNLVWAVSGNNLFLSWPGDHLGWRLLVQTNNLAGGVSQNTNDWGTVYNSQQTNQIALPVAPALTAEFYRLVYP